MELTQEFIESLVVNEVEIMKALAQNLSVQTSQVSAVVGLLTEGCTIPFISRYRKELTGSLDEVQVREIDRGFSSRKNMEGRRLEIVRGIFSQGKLTEALYENIMKAASLTELEDIYLPYKKKKKTRAMIAEERGLEPLAEAMLNLATEELRAKAAEFVRLDADNPTLSVPDLEAALQGAMDIIAERIAQDSENRARIKRFYLADGKLKVTGLGDEAVKKTSTYQMYWDYLEPLSQIKAHRVLAINRGEREGQLAVTIEIDEETAVERLQQAAVIHNSYHAAAIEDGLKRLLSPAVLRELRSDQAELADDHGISVFSQNLKNLLMQQPIKGTRVLGVDPGLRTGTKCAALNETGKYLGSFVIFQHKPEEAKRLLLEAIKNYDIQFIAIGNGTGSREAQELVTAVIADYQLEVLYTVVDEDGASVYSAGDIAREEFPELDLTIRGAISIGRRLQDPLAELVKIDPKSIGVGLYQHDVSQKKLSESLDGVVSSVVNNVGVSLNTASASLLRYVSGINSSLAKKIVKFREENGQIANRQALMAVAGMGPKTFEQCAGFLKIPESDEPLDNSWVHPENYPVAREILTFLTTSAGQSVVSQSETKLGNLGSISGALSADKAHELKERYGVGPTTLNDLVEELKKPNRDPREAYPKPIIRRGLVNYEDLQLGMMVTGKVKNVVDFGAFVDLGLKETALLHISEMSDQFVKDPLRVLKVGDVKEFRIIALDPDRRRISLSLKSRSTSQPMTSQSATSSDRPAAEINSGTANRGQRQPPAVGRSHQSATTFLTKNDDGDYFNPFAEAFKKTKDQSSRRK